MPRRGNTPVHDPPTRKGRRTRQRLLDAAEQVFGDVGYERAAIADITRQAGVALGTFYVYFPSKLAIFRELVNELGHGLRRRLAEAVTGLEGRLEIERAGCTAFLEFVGAHRSLYRIVRQAEFVDERLFRDYYERLAASYVRGLEQAIDTGEIQALDPETIAYTLMGIFDFLGMRWVLWADRMPPRRVVDDVFALIRHGLAPTGARELDRKQTAEKTSKKKTAKKKTAKKKTAKKTSKRKTAKKTSTKKTSTKKTSTKKTSTKKTSTKKAAKQQATRKNARTTAKRANTRGRSRASAEN